MDKKIADIDQIRDELKYDFIIVHLTDNVLPQMTYGQLDALKHACEVEIRERTDPNETLN